MFKVNMGSGLGTLLSLITKVKVEIYWQFGWVTQNQGGDRRGSTMVGRIFLLWFGLAKKVWLFGCSLVDIWQYN